jgi:methionyl-tRNA formyltransferase
MSLDFDSRAAVACGRGAVEIVEIQPEGGRVMPLPAFRNGHSWKPGMRVESI